MMQRGFRAPFHLIIVPPLARVAMFTLDNMDLSMCDREAKLSEVPKRERERETKRDR